MIFRNYLPWLRTRVPECAVLVSGLFLRMTMLLSYKPGWGFDAQGHFQYIDWILTHRSVPAPAAFFHAFHPPLFYVIAAATAGRAHRAAMWIPIVLGTLRLCIIWAGLELFFRKQRWARLSALALAAVIPASVHVDGLVYGESLSGFLIASAMLLTVLVFRQPARSRWRLSILLGLVLGLAMLTKISGIVIVFAVGIGAILELLFSPHLQWRVRFQNLLPWLATLIVCFAVCGWYFVPIARAYGRPFITSFDTLQTGAIADSRATPLLDRRTLGFVFGWDVKIYRHPYWPSGAVPNARFFPMAVASTFVDYYNFSFSGLDPDTFKSTIWSNDRPLTRPLMNVSRLAAMGGTCIAFATAVAFAACLQRGLRWRRWDIVALLVGAGLTVLAALYFAIEHPTDGNGVIKGTYLQFGAPPLYAMFGVAVAWTQRKPWRRIWLAGLLASLWLVASYTLYCRARILLPPAPWM